MQTSQRFMQIVEDDSDDEGADQQDNYAVAQIRYPAVFRLIDAETVNVRGQGQCDVEDDDQDEKQEEMQFLA